MEEFFIIIREAFFCIIIIYLCLYAWMASLFLESLIDRKHFKKWHEDNNRKYRKNRL